MTPKGRSTHGAWGRLVVALQLSPTDCPSPPATEGTTRTANTSTIPAARCVSTVRRPPVVSRRRRGRASSVQHPRSVMSITDRGGPDPLTLCFVRGATSPRAHHFSLLPCEPICAWLLPKHDQSVRQKNVHPLVFHAPAVNRVSHTCRSCMPRPFDEADHHYVSHCIWILHRHNRMCLGEWRL